MFRLNIGLGRTYFNRYGGRKSRMIHSAMIRASCAASANKHFETQLIRKSKYFYCEQLGNHILKVLIPLEVL
ncbi:hypothetical protein DESC_720365 [Desulfosarcina cetonica]|nr:hypothetical protein DESC_720365 [Desulfosarcina cetonica]